jgi:hypothetical protein
VLFALHSATSSYREYINSPYRLEAINSHEGLPACAGLPTKRANAGQQQLDAILPHRPGSYDRGRNQRGLQCSGGRKQRKPFPVAGLKALRPPGGRIQRRCRLPVAEFSASPDRPLVEFSVTLWVTKGVGYPSRPSGGRFQRITHITGRHERRRKGRVAEFSANATREACGQQVYIEMIIGSEANRNETVAFSAECDHRRTIFIL